MPSPLPIRPCRPKMLAFTYVKINRLIDDPEGSWCNCWWMVRRSCASFLLKVTFFCKTMLPHQGRSRPKTPKKSMIWLFHQAQLSAKLCYYESARPSYMIQENSFYGKKHRRIRDECASGTRA